MTHTLEEIIALAKEVEAGDAIDWIRPDPLKWIDSKNNERNYFPDFYLTDLNLYLDPKNSAAYKQQIEKVTWLKEHVKNLVFLLSMDEIKNFTPQ